METFTVNVCGGTACVVMGGSHLFMLEEVLPERLLGRVEVRGARCLGCCQQDRKDKGPYVTINGDVLGNATIPRVLEFIEQLEALASADAAKADEEDGSRGL